MSVLPIYLYGHNVLRTVAKPVDVLDDSAVKLIVDMFETMRKANGIGLAATQVGDKRRVIVIDLTGVDESEEGEDTEKSMKIEGPKILVLINPEVLEEEGSWVMEEGCLSIPEVRADVKRAEIIKVRFKNANFESEELTVSGLVGRVILHEIDHLNGVLFIDRINSAKRALLKPKLTPIKKGDVETSYPIVTSPEDRLRARGMRRKLGNVEA